MKRSIVKIGALISVLPGVCLLQGRDMRTPLSVSGPYGYMHYPLHHHDEREKKCLNVDVEIFQAMYNRNAYNAFDCSGERTQVPLSTLMFNQPVFSIAQAFPNSFVGGAIPTNPFVTVSELAPRIDYEEEGMMFGLTLGMHSKSNRWHYGLRIHLPYREIEMEEQCDSTATAGGSVDVSNLRAVFATRQETITNATTPPQTETNEVFAVRLDYLTALNIVAVPAQPFVIYSDPTSGGVITMAGQNVTGNIPSAGTVTFEDPSIAVIGSNLGVMPTAQRWGDFTTAISDVVAADGSGVSNGTRARFASDVNYTPLGTNTPAQGTLFVVPSIDSTSSLITSGAQIILDQLNRSLGSLQGSVNDFLVAQGVDFCTTSTMGIGDLDIEFYASHDWSKRVWTELEFGIRLPTGHKIRNPLQLLLQPLGNNGHVELRGGLIAGFDCTRSLKLKVDAAYTWVLEATEQVAAAFQGATVKNIGPVVPARVKWQYFVGHVDATFLHPRNQSLGCNLGYEFFYKHADQIRYCSPTAADFIGNVAPVDSCLAAARTREIAHKVRSEVFYIAPCCNVFLGFSSVVAGKNVPVETDMHVGLSVYY